MIAPDIWSRLWLLVLTYPALAFMVAVILYLLVTLVALALVSLSRPDLPLHRWEDDEEQLRAVTRPGALVQQPWGRSGGNWWLK